MWGRKKSKPTPETRNARPSDRAFHSKPKRRSGLVSSLRGLGQKALERLERVGGERRVERTHLARLADKALVSALRISRLHLDRLFKALGTDQLLEHGRVLLERLA